MYLHAAAIIQEGLDKLADYRNCNRASDAYTLATSKCSIMIKVQSSPFAAINPAFRLKWFELNTSLQKTEAAQRLFLAEVRIFLNF